MMDRGDNAALRAAANGAKALATVTGIDGSFSRRLGAQLAIMDDGSCIGSLADGCLEAELARLVQAMPERARQRQVVRFGQGGAALDFRLPCGGGLDIQIEKNPDRAILCELLLRLDSRKAATLTLPAGDGPIAMVADRPTGHCGSDFYRYFAPDLRLLVLGTGPELDAVLRIADAMGIATAALVPRGGDGDGALGLGRAPEAATVDQWTAILMLFHDHEWERTLVPWALSTPAMFIGAQGGRLAREERSAMLRSAGFSETELARIHSPVGLIGAARDPDTLGLSAVAQIVSGYQRAVHDRGI